MYVLKIVIYVILVYLTFQIALRIFRKTIHLPVPPFMGRILDSRLRMILQSPTKIIKQSCIKPGMKVLEVGCGSGAYTTFISEYVGKEGKVYALDIQEKMLEQIKEKIAIKNEDVHNNIVLIHGDACKLPVDVVGVDMVCMVLSLQEIPDRHKALEEARRVLKPGGLISITEFLPDPDYPFIATTKNVLTKAGFEIEGVQGNFWSYTVTGIKKAS